MKNVILIGAMLMSFTFAQASNVSEKEKNDKHKQSAQQSITSVINEAMKYPDDRGAELEGIAHCMIVLNDDGGLELMMINSENQELGAFIKEKLDTIHLDAGTFIPGQVFRFRFDFKYLG